MACHRPPPTERRIGHDHVARNAQERKVPNRFADVEVRERRCHEIAILQNRLQHGESSGRVVTRDPNRPLDLAEGIDRSFVVARTEIPPKTHVITQSRRDHRGIGIDEVPHVLGQASPDLLGHDFERRLEPCRMLKVAKEQKVPRVESLDVTWNRRERAVLFDDVQLSSNDAEPSQYLSKTTNDPPLDLVDQSARREVPKAPETPSQTIDTCWIQICDEFRRTGCPPSQEMKIASANVLDRQSCRVLEEEVAQSTLEFDDCFSIPRLSSIHIPSLSGGQCRRAILVRLDLSPLSRIERHTEKAPELLRHVVSSNIDLQ